MDGYYYEDMKITGCLKEETEQAYFAESLCNMLSSSADGAKFKIDFMYDTKTDSYQGSYKLIPIYSETRDNLYDSSVDMTEDEDRQKTEIMIIGMECHPAKKQELHAIHRLH